MITTQYGNEVEVLRKGDDEEEIVCLRKTDSKERTYHISQLRADGGIDEIQSAIAATEKR